MTKPKRSIKRMGFVLLAIAVILLTSLVIYLNNPLSYRGAVADEPTTLPDLPKQKIGNVPIITLEGTPYQMGYQHGLLLRGEIQEMIKILHTVTGQTPTPQGWAKSTYLNYLALSYFHAVPERYRQELRGLARGAGVSLRELILLNSYDDIYQLSQCTSLAVWGRYTRSGQPVHGRNLDYELTDRLWNRQVVFVYKPGDGYPFISVAWPGYIGVFTGMNQGGLALGALSSRTPKDSIQGVPLGILYREVLQFSQRFSDAEKILAGRKRTTGSNLILTSAKDRSGMVFEITADRVAARYGDELIGAANHFNRLEGQNSFAYSPESTHRQHRVEELARESLASSRLIGLKEMVKILGDQKLSGPETRMVGNHLNLQSVVFLPNRRELWVSINEIVPAAAGGFVGFRFTPELPNPMQYLGSTKVQSNYLEAQAGFWDEEPAHWTEEKINTVFARYLERDSDPLYFMYEEARFYAMIGHYEQSVQLYETLLDSINRQLKCEIEKGLWFTVQREWIEIALAKVYCARQTWERAEEMADNILRDEGLDQAIRSEAELLKDLAARRQIPAIADLAIPVERP